MSTPAVFNCPACKTPLTQQGASLTCPSCAQTVATISEDVAIFQDTKDKEGFFERRACEELQVYYKNYSRKEFDDALARRDLWNMDIANKKVGITQKLWWERSIGRIVDQNVLEVGCGVNYLISHWLNNNNNVVAFDICKESVLFTKKITDILGFPKEKLTLAVADAQTTSFNRTFDVINMNNVLHHIKDKRSVFSGLRDSLSDQGHLLLVEPNYYYPPRWAIETNLFDKVNVIKGYFVKNYLIEKGEKAAIFSELKEDLAATGYTIVENFKDPNYLGYFTLHWLPSSTKLGRLIFLSDKYFFDRILPAKLAPFEFIIAKKTR